MEDRSITEATQGKDRLRNLHGRVAESLGWRDINYDMSSFILEGVPPGQKATEEAPRRHFLPSWARSVDLCLRDLVPHLPAFALVKREGWCAHSADMESSHEDPAMAIFNLYVLKKSITDA